jgi:hypothetical protein
MMAGGSKKKCQQISQVTTERYAKGVGTNRNAIEAVVAAGTSTIPTKAAEIYGIKQTSPVEVQIEMEEVGGTIVRLNFGMEIMMMRSLVLLLPPPFLAYIMGRHLKLPSHHRPSEVVEGELVMGGVEVEDAAGEHLKDGVDTTVVEVEAPNHKC